MENYDVQLEDIASKELQSLPKPFIARIFRKIESLGNNPRPVGYTKLTGFSDLYRIRSGDFRIVYSVNDVSRRIVVLRIRHRRDVYRGL